MKSTGFTKYIPVSEAEYQKFREVQNKQAKLTREELNRPSALTPLVETQNDKVRTLFHQSDNPDLQEQRYTHLVNILNELKRQVEQQNQPQMHQASMPPKFQQQPQLQQQIQVQRAQLQQPQKRKKSKKIKGFVLVEKRKRDNVHKIKDTMKPKRRKLKMHLRSADGEKILTDSRVFRQFMNSM